MLTNKRQRGEDCCPKSEIGNRIHSSQPRANEKIPIFLTPRKLQASLVHAKSAFSPEADPMACSSEPPLSLGLRNSNFSSEEECDDAKKVCEDGQRDP
jgi:hypothetical protein